MSINYDTLTTTLQNLLVDNGSADYTQILPQAIAYAENRLYRELDLLSCRGTDTSVILSTTTRNATCPATISVVEGISYLTPAGNSPPNATRNGIDRASLDFIDRMYGDETVKGPPIYFAMKSDTAIVLAPTADQAYKIEITGTVQPAPMSSTNETTFLGNYFQDLLVAGCMIFMSNWQRDAGSQFSPQDMNNWQTAYDAEFKSAQEFVQRQKSQDPNWNPFTPTPLSQPRT